MSNSEKSKLIDEKFAELADIDNEISVLTNKRHSIEEELNILYAPVIPENMKGHYLKEFDRDNKVKAVIRVDSIESVGFYDEPELSMIKYIGYGLSIIRDCDNGTHLHIANCITIVKCDGDNCGNWIAEISETEFLEAMTEMQEKIKQPITKE